MVEEVGHAMGLETVLAHPMAFLHHFHYCYEMSEKYLDIRYKCS
jgi:hypothetical protein